MPRPVKCRKIQRVPRCKYFRPANIPNCKLEENKLKVEELEAIRLKDLEGLDQESCAQSMEVSRQTFQRIYHVAKKKIADSLVNGKAIAIGGGNYTKKTCHITCQTCGYHWKGPMEDVASKDAVPLCPECQSKSINCQTKKVKECCHCRSEEEQSPVVGQER